MKEKQEHLSNEEDDVVDKYFSLPILLLLVTFTEQSYM